jgi:hydrogenase maturation protein HypF
MSVRIQILVRGTVQGVGFRPFVFKLAQRRALRGRVLNNASGVLIDVEGERRAIDDFIQDIRTEAPPLARIEAIEMAEALEDAGYQGFSISESLPAQEKYVAVSPDIATCSDCIAELFDRGNRRYKYPFINCTNCGPRFTIIQDIPYDRERTTMRAFHMCAACRREYSDPLDRRYHAEPIACPACGPSLRLADSQGRTIDAADVMAEARTHLLDGRILAIKGIGGFHLACDASNETAVGELRRRKRRSEKPFAMMVASLDVVRRFCELSSHEAELLSSPARPVVVIRGRSTKFQQEFSGTSPNYHAFMLPYSPLHYVLFENLDRPLVMTSGNLSDEPICYRDDDALQRLGSIADYFVLHDRPIHMRTDDSVVCADAAGLLAIRRSRGYAPAPLRTSVQFSKTVLACGAELKNTFCFGRGRDAFLSHYIGDLEDFGTSRSFEESIGHFQKLFGLQPEIIAYDLHPEYLSTKYAIARDDVQLRAAVQHHHAHIVSCMADNRIDGEVIGVAMDGLGYGLDGRFWGCEFLAAGFVSATRLAHLENVPMPGGSQAIRQPWRMAATYLNLAFGDGFLDLPIPFVHRLDRHRWRALKSMIASGTNCPETSSMGRLFDAIAALAGVRDTCTYEGQAAMELEILAAGHPATAGYIFEVSPNGVIDAAPVIRAAVDDLQHGATAATVSARFHRGVAAMIASVACGIRKTTGLRRVALSGGVFQNLTLSNASRELLASNGFEVFTHKRVPPNDGGIALGQAVIANARYQEGQL